jgi:hypothetical protein
MCGKDKAGIEEDEAVELNDLGVFRHVITARGYSLTAGA